MTSSLMRFSRNGFIQVTAVAAGVLLAAAFFVGPAAGEGLHVASSVQSGEVIDNDLLLTGFEGTIDGMVIGNVFATGKEVTVNGEVTGSLFVLGDKISVNGDVGGGTYAVGVSLQQGSRSVIDLNLYFLGINLRTESGAVVGRDLVMVALSANLSGEVGRDTRAIVGLLEFIRLIGDGLSQGILGKSIDVASEYEGGTSLASLSGLARPSIIPSAVPVGEPALQQISSEEVIEILLDCLRALVSFLIVGSLALWLLPSMFRGATEQLRARPLVSAGFGTLVFINGFLLTVLLAAVFVGVGLGLRALTLDALGWAFWGVSFSSLGLAFSLFIISLVWLSKATVATLAGAMILERLYPRALDYRASPLVLGLLIYIVLCPIPIFGWVVALIVTVLGLGGLSLSVREIKRARKAPPKKK